MTRPALISLLARTAIVGSALFGVMGLGALGAGRALSSGNVIAFIAAHGSYTIHILDIDRRSYAELEAINTLAFAMSPNGREIAFTDLAYTDDAPGLYVMGTFGANLRQIAQVRYVQQPLVWSPDSRQVAFLDRNPLQDAAVGSNAIFVTDTDGGGKRQLTDDPNFYVKLRWSPDGKAIAAVSSQQQIPQIFIIPPDGGKARLLTTSERGNIIDLDWSADGQSLRFMWSLPVSNDTTDYAFYAIDADGKNLQVLSQGNAEDGEYFRLIGQHDPPPVIDGKVGITGEVSWSPDNRWIAYPTSSPPIPTSVLTGGGVIISFNTMVISRADGSDERIFVSKFHSLNSPVFIPR